MSDKSKTVKADKATAQELVPKLRFPEFRDAGAWDKYPLGQCLSQHPEYGINAPAVPYSDKLPTYLRITDISEDGYFLRNQKVSVANKVTEENYLNEGDIVLARTGASVGKSYKYRIEDGKLVFAGFLIRVKPDKEKLNSELLFHFLTTEQFWRWVDFTSARSGQPGINGNEYSLLPISLPPSLKEQQKIADCLSSIDELITAQSQKIDTLKAHKKGLMQQLFPAQGETVPKLRFPEFRNAGVWEEKQVKDALNYERPDRYIVRDTNYHQSGTPVLTANKSFVLGYTHEKQGISTDTPVIIFDDFTVDKKYVDFPFKVKSSAIKILKIKGKNNLKFIFELMSQIKLETAEHKRYYISVYQNLFVRLPKPPEQQKIADCLSSIDELITAQSQKIDTLKAHKKGLMQQLFPSTDEVNR